MTDADRARSLVAEADRLFRAGDAAGSIPLLVRAYALGGWAGCLLNLAMANHALSNCEVASDYYERYLMADPYTDRLEEVMGALGELDACGSSRWTPPGLPSAVESPSGSLPSDTIRPLSSAAVQPLADPSGAPAPAVPLPSAPHSPEPSHRVLAVSLLGVGAAAGIAAAVFTLASQRKESEAGEFSTFGADDPRARAIHDAGVHYNELAWGLGIGAVALLGAGTTLWILGNPADSSVGVGLAFPSIRYQGRF